MAETLQNAHEELQHSIDQATEDAPEPGNHRDPEHRAGPGAQRGPGSQPHQVRVPGQHEPRNPHAAQRHSRLHPPAAKKRTDPAPARLPGHHRKSADNLLGIINEILDFSKIEAGKLVLDSIPFNLRDLLQDTLTILAPAAHAKQLELVSLVYRDTPLSLVGDPLRLKQILTNLVSNAIKFTREGTIVARAMLEDEQEDSVQLRISVQDTGIGLSNQDVRAVPGLQPGRQLAVAPTRRHRPGPGDFQAPDRADGRRNRRRQHPGRRFEFWISLNLPKTRDDAEDLPARHCSATRGGRWKTTSWRARPCSINWKTAAHVTPFNTLESLTNGVTGAHQTDQAIDLAARRHRNDMPPERLNQHIWDLEHLGCKVLVLCPTTEQTLFHQSVPNPHSHCRPNRPAPANCVGRWPI
jgi:two-component system sensor histidine kinase BarA